MIRHNLFPVLFEAGTFLIGYYVVLSASCCYWDIVVDTSPSRIWRRGPLWDSPRSLRLVHGAGNYSSSAWRLALMCLASVANDARAVIRYLVFMFTTRTWTSVLQEMSTYSSLPPVLRSFELPVGNENWEKKKKGRHVVELASWECRDNAVRNRRVEVH